MKSGRERIALVLMGGVALLMAACGGAGQTASQEDEGLPEVTFAHPEYIVSAEQAMELVARAAEDDSFDLLVLDARSASDYQSGHIPGAVHLPPSRLDREAGEFDFQVRPAEEMEPILQAAGINSDSQVLIYDSGGTFNAARVWWVLDYYGHTQKSVLNGGFAGWELAGGDKTAVPYDVEPGDFVPVPDPNKIADYQYVLDHLGTDATSVCDARREADYAQAAVPGAVNLPYTDTFADSGVMTKDAAQLQDMFASVGLEPQEEIIFYCIGGYLSSQDFLLARALGYTNVRVYDGSIIEWNVRDGPTEPSGGA